MRRATVLAVLVLGWMGLGAVGPLPTSAHDIAYGPDVLQRLDLSLPAGKKFPTVIFVHGGSLTDGDKADEDYRNVCAPFIAAGIACASVNYRLGPEHPWPAQAEDVAAAVAWVRAHIGERSGDPEKLFLMGHSSGAMLAAVVGADARYLERHHMKPRDLRGVLPMGSIMWDVELERAIETYGRDTVAKVFAGDVDQKIYGSLDAYLEHWPMRHVSDALPPFLFLIAEGEQENPPVLETNAAFVDSARARKNQADLEVLRGRTHMSAIRKLGEPEDSVFVIVRDFIRAHGGSP